ncbi:hypothetical protein LCGC14_0428760 [marine sediment metagenome]|uniref:Uncharacterized protein n=1 Tax=marine sediment metagenome TaxID=412755 RepID=A0A0F9VY01_9ZZZZ
MCNPLKMFEDVVKLVASKDRLIREQQAEIERLRMALARWMTHPSAECVPTQAIEMGRRALAGKNIADLDVVVIARKAEAEVERLRDGLQNILDNDLGSKRVRHNRDTAIGYARQSVGKLLAAEAAGGE